MKSWFRKNNEDCVILISYDPRVCVQNIEIYKSLSHKLFFKNLGQQLSLSLPPTSILPLQVITEPCWLPVLCSSLPRYSHPPPSRPSKSSQSRAGSLRYVVPRLAICFTRGGVYISLLLSQFAPLSPSPTVPTIPFSMFVRCGVYTYTEVS